MKRKTLFVCMFLAVTLMLGSAPTAAAAGGNSGMSEEEQIKIVSNWLDSLRLADSSEAPKQTTPPSQTKPAAGTYSEEDLNAYENRVFEIVNQERENAGVGLLDRDDTLDEAAKIRAMECASVNSLYIDGKAHIRPDGSRWFTVLGIEKNYNYGENVGQGGTTADIRMKSFMNSEGHKANILREDYTEIGIGCAVSAQGEIFTVQIFYLP